MDFSKLEGKTLTAIEVGTYKRTEREQARRESEQLERYAESHQ